MMVNGPQRGPFISWHTDFVNHPLPWKTSQKALYEDSFPKKILSRT